MSSWQLLADMDSIVGAVAKDLDALASATAGTFSIALAGGSTPARLYRRLAAGPAPSWWDRTKFFFGDERCVPPNHEDSNYAMVVATLLSRATPADNVFRIHAELDPAEAAARYEETLVRELGTPPTFDLVLLGLGTDAHTASLFPGSPALAAADRWVVENPVATLQTTRITLTLATLNAARQVWFVVSGAGKKDAVREVLTRPPSPRAPASLVRPWQGVVKWYLDVEAGAELAPSPRL